MWADVRSRARTRAARIAGGWITLAMVTSASAQPPSSPAPFRAPAIAMVQPPGGGTVPRAKPVVVFRLAAGEAADPLDVRTFAVTVDAVDRTNRFQVTADQAWGTIVDPPPGDSVAPTGVHAVAARICSVRGACAETVDTVVVAAGVIDRAISNDRPAVANPPSSLRARVIELLLDAVRKLIKP